MHVWNFGSYYLWEVYKVFEGDLLNPDADLNNPRLYAPIRRFLRKDLVLYQAILASRKGRPAIAPNWCRRIWLYRNLDPTAMPELEGLLQKKLEKHIELFEQKATDAAAQAVELRDAHFLDVPLVLGEGASYCADSRLRLDECSDAYWEVVEHAGVPGVTTACWVLSCARMPARKTLSGTGTPNDCSRPMQCFWHRKPP